MQWSLALCSALLSVGEIEKWLLDTLLVYPFASQEKLYVGSVRPVKDDWCLIRAGGALWMGARATRARLIIKRWAKMRMPPAPILLRYNHRASCLACFSYDETGNVS